MTMSENRTTDMLVSFGVGLLVGAAAGLLLAPNTGEETRRRLGEFGEGALDRARTGLDAARRAAGDQVERLATAVKEGKEAYAREVTKG